MKGPEQLLENEDHWVTRMGLSFPGERVVFRGKDLLNDLKNMPWMGLLLYGITGREFNESQIRLFEGIWVLSSSYPDPRLWNNRVASLAGTARSTGSLGIGASIAVSEASIYGQRPVIRCIDFLQRTKIKLDAGAELAGLIHEDIRKYRGIPGYGRPIVSRDERIAPMIKLAEEVGLSGGAHFKLAFQVDEVLAEKRLRMRMNIAAVGAALAADMEFSSREYYMFTIMCFTAGMFPCMIEAGEKTEGTFLPVRCERIAYQGIPRRVWR